MTLARTVAGQVAASYGRDPWTVAQSLDLPVYEEPLPAGVRELYFEDPADSSVCGVALDVDLPAREARALLAHALAHHLLHVGNRLYRGSSVLWSGRHEREADDFAAYLLIPEEELVSSGDQIDSPSIDEFADRLGVECDVVQRRLLLLQHDHPRLLDGMSKD